MPIRIAVGTSLVVVTALGLTTAASYALSGFVDWRLVAILVAEARDAGAMPFRKARQTDFGNPSRATRSGRLVSSASALHPGYPLPGA